MELTPKQVVRELDRYIIGQDEAKRAVAVALRNRYRRAQLPEEIRDEIVPKNILMVGPTGVGKTEIARRLHTLFEKMLEDISFNAGGDMPDVDVTINGDYVAEHLGTDAKKMDMRQYIL